ncbi:MAG: hypothetical protein M0Z59_09900 [Nitrospiraceae bacterium]|nr:hypothetical protein [Nitrospiraceae bacterium]
MSDAWYEGLPQAEADRIYEESIKRIKSAVEQGMSFEQAAGLVDVKDGDLKKSILGDALKVMIAEVHFMAGMELPELARKLKLPLKVLEDAKKEMLADVEEAAIQKFKEESGQSGKA